MQATGYLQDRINSHTQHDVLPVFYALDAHLIPICMINIGVKFEIGGDVCQGSNQTAREVNIAALRRLDGAMVFVVYF
jgi:hypothetical protein